MDQPQPRPALPDLPAPPAPVAGPAAAAILLPQELAAAPVEDDRVAGALEAMPQLMALMQSGQFGQAAEMAEAIAEHVAPLVGQDASGLPAFLSAYARLFEQTARGTAKLRLGAFTDALSAFQQAISIGRKSVLPLAALGVIEGLAPEGIALQIDVVAANILTAQLFDALKQESYADAQRRAGQVVLAWQAIMARVDAVPSPEAERSQLKLAGESEIAIAIVFGLLAEAESARQARAWEDALNGYDAVGEAIRDASQKAADMGMPIAMDAHTALLNSTLVAVARKRLEENRALIEEGRRGARDTAAALQTAQAEAAAWKAATEALRGWAPTISIQNVNELSASLSVMVQVTEVAQQRLAGDLAELGRAIAAAPLPEDERATLLERIAALDAGKGEKGDGFFKKVAGFSEDAAKILKNVKEVAGPLATVVRWVAPFAPAAAALLHLG